MATTTSEARRDPFGLIERVNLDHTEVVEIPSKRGSAALMSKDEYDALVETSYLLRSPQNARRLLNAMGSARAGLRRRAGTYGALTERKLAWTAEGWEDHLDWQTQDRKTLRRINALIGDILRDDPFEGIGKPEALKRWR